MRHLDAHLAPVCERLGMSQEELGRELAELVPRALPRPTSALARRSGPTGPLGPYWRAVYSDMIPDPRGNRERIAFLYGKRAVTFTGFAATATPPRTKKGTEYLPDRSWWRPPYAASFQAGNFDFVVIAAHIRWGDSRKGRLAELELFAEWIAAKRKEPTAVDKDILVMGDFNLEDDEMFKVLTG